MIYYKKFASCISVKGSCSSAVYDLDRKDVWSIDNFTYEILKNNIISEELFDVLSQDVRRDLLGKEIIFPCRLDEVGMFPDIVERRVSPLQIQSCIVDIDPSSMIDINRLANQLDELGCRSLQIRFSSTIDHSRVEWILKVLKGKNIRSIELVVSFCGVDYVELINNYKIITSVSVYGAPQIGISKCNGSKIITTTESYNGVEQCGIVEPNYFVCNREMFFESLRCNSCLEKKISISRQGEIKNCPSCIKSYGNIRDTNLKLVLENQDFNRVWSITKDQIDVCKDCEFRFMCTDCRVFIKDPNNIYSQPSKCNYNPYIAKWAGEEGYVPVEECGTYSPETGFVVNAKKVDELNQRVMA